MKLSKDKELNKITNAMRITNANENNKCQTKITNAMRITQVK